MNLTRDIYLPHINYTVCVRPFSKAPDIISSAQVWCESNNKNQATIYLKKNSSPPQIAHEIVHILRYIVRDRYMDFTLEEEHMAYLMQYILGKILGYEYEK